MTEKSEKLQKTLERWHRYFVSTTEYTDHMERELGASAHGPGRAGATMPSSQGHVYLYVTLIKSFVLVDVIEQVVRLSVSG